MNGRLNPISSLASDCLAGGGEMGGADALHGLVEDGRQRSQILVAYNSIREDVLREIKWDPRKISASDITVAVKDKVVTLSGFCSNLLG